MEAAAAGHMPDTHVHVLGPARSHSHIHVGMYVLQWWGSEEEGGVGSG